MSKNTRNRILLTAVAALLLVVMSVAGTMAWLVDTTEEVKNTFETTGIDIKLEETVDSTFELIPGVTYDKDPVVSVIRPTTDVDIWLYVKITDESAAPYLSAYDCTLYEGNAAANDWEKLEDGVYYRKVLKDEATKGNCPDAGCDLDTPHWHLIAGDTITVNADLVKAGTEGADLVMPTDDVYLAYEAYACQADGFTDGNQSGDTADEAWAANFATK